MVCCIVQLQMALLWDVCSLEGVGIQHEYWCNDAKRLGLDLCLTALQRGINLLQLCMAADCS